MPRAAAAAAATDDDDDGPSSDADYGGGGGGGGQSWDVSQAGSMDLLSMEYICNLLERNRWRQ